MDQWVWVHLQLIWPFRGHLEELAAAVADRLVFMITEITPVKAYHETENLPHSGCFIGIFLCTDWMSEFSVTEAFYAQLYMELESCPEWDILIVLGDFNATTGTDRDDYVLVLAALDRETEARYSLTSKSRRLRMVGSWLLKPDLHHWTWYSSSGGSIKK